MDNSIVAMDSSNVLMVCVDPKCKNWQFKLKGMLNQKTMVMLHYKDDITGDITAFTKEEIEELLK